jgi:hypothetical protein
VRPLWRHPYVDKAAAEQAVALALPMLESAMRNAEVGESGFLYIVVMDPAITPHAARFEDAVLYEHAIGDPAKWDADYARFAREGPVELAARHGQPSAAGTHAASATEGRYRSLGQRGLRWDRSGSERGESLVRRGIRGNCGNVY